MSLMLIVALSMVFCSSTVTLVLAGLGYTLKLIPLLILAMPVVDLVTSTVSVYTLDVHPPLSSVRVMTLVPAVVQLTV